MISWILKKLSLGRLKTNLHVFDERVFEEFITRGSRTVNNNTTNDNKNVVTFEIDVDSTEGVL